MKLVLIQPTLSSEDALNGERIARLLQSATLALNESDLVLLPEHWDTRGDQATHLADLRRLSRDLGCHIVGGSYHEPSELGFVNAGYVVTPGGQVVTRYEKLRPYAEERTRVRAGTALGRFVLEGRKWLVMICADFWFSDLFDTVGSLPDVVLVPALSVTRKPAPDYSRALWTHLAIGRAYEFGVYVGISDWASNSKLPALGASGVAGFADPTTPIPARLYDALGQDALRVYELEFEVLDAFRDDRKRRGFFWRPA